MKPMTDWDTVPLVLSPVDAAQLLGCSTETVRRRMRDGELESVSVRGRRLTTKQALMALLRIIPQQAHPEVDPQVYYHLEQAQHHHNEAMRLLEVR